MTASEDTEIAHEVLRTIRQIVRKVSEHSKAMYQDVGLTVPQLMCLKAVGDLEEDSDEVTVVMVAKQLNLSAATVSRIVDRLTRANLVTRERRAKDRRKVCLSLTAAGLERFQTLPIPLQEKFVRRLSDLPAKERSELLASLRHIAELMEAPQSLRMSSSLFGSMNTKAPLFFSRNSLASVVFPILLLPYITTNWLVLEALLRHSLRALSSFWRSTNILSIQ